MIDFIDHEKLDSEGFKKLKKPGEGLFIDSHNKEAVKGVQTFLNNEGFRDGKGEPLAVDGVAGANTANAVMGYQRKKGLTVDGIVGDETWNSIYKDKKKKEESLFGGKEKIYEGIVLPTTPEGPKRDTYTPKSERKDNHFSSNFDVWSGIGNPLKDYGKSDDESFHDKVRRRWGNGGNPSRVLSLSRDNTPGISTSPFRTYKPKGIAFDDYAFPEDESGFSGSNRRTDIPESEYLPEDEIFATEEPELTLMSNSGSGKGTNSNSKAEEKEEKLGIIKPGYNAKGEWSEDPDADNYGKDSAKYKVISKLDIMCAKANDQNRKVITSFCNDFRKFDENLICRVYYLNDKDGANNFGHTGVLLVNSDGQGLLFSYGAATDKFIYGSSRMNVGVYTPNEVWGILRGKETTVLSTKGFNTSEQYERWVYYDVSTDEGKDMFETAAKALYEPENYAVFWNNCDQVVDEIFDAGGEHVTSMIWPNATYEKEKFQDNVKEISRDIKKYSLKLYNKLRSIWE